MSEQANNVPALEDALEFYPSDPSIIAIEDTLDTFLAAASVEAVYGEPVEHGDSLIIPMAEVLSAVGFGLGSGYGKSPAGEQGEEGEPASDQVNIGSGGGGGGGGRVLSRPVGVIIASPEGVRIEPVLDVTKIALAALTAAGFMTAMLMRMSNPRQALKSIKSG